MRWASSIAIGAFLSVAAQASAAPVPRDVSAAQQYLSETYGGKPADYSLLDERLIVSGSTPLWTAKFLDTRVNNVIRLVYRDALGDIGGDELRREAKDQLLAGKSQLERKASLDLLTAAANATGKEPLPVAVWMDVDTTEAVKTVIDAHPEGEWLLDRPTVDALDTQREMRRLLDSARSTVYADAAKDVAAAIEGAGGRIGYVSLLAPLAYVDTPAETLTDLAANPRVRSLGLEGDGWVESLASAGPYVHANWISSGSDQGTGTRVGVIEYYNVHNTGDLAGKVVASHSMSGTITYAPGFDHPTWVAGAVASQDSVNTGIAPGAVIVSSSTGGGVSGLTRDRNVISAADWAATAGDADIINVSVNMDSASGRDEARAYFDSIGGGETYRTVVASAGNYGTGYDPGWIVTSPGTGWNVLTVGGMNDGTGELWYDPTCPCTGAKWEEDSDPDYNPHGDFGKPNISAPAVSVNTANGLIEKGTSVAAPIVSGIAAQSFARNPLFVSWPEPLRAIVMAGAYHRVPLPGGSFTNSPDHEGIGTADAQYAARVYGNPTYGGWDYGSLTENQTLQRQFTVTAGQRVRIVLTWDSHTTGTMFNKQDTLKADLDLIVNYPGGSRSALTNDNNYEFVGFTAPSSGTVTINVAQPRFDGTVEYWGLGWLHY